MFYNHLFRESDEQDAMDALLPQDPNTDEGANAMADEVEANMQAEAFANIGYFEGGNDAARTFFESAEVRAVMEGSVSTQTVGGLSKRKTLVLLSKNDDLERRAKLACIIISRDKKEAVFDRWVKHRQMERADRKEMYQKHYKEGLKIARISQKKHIAERKKFPLPGFNKSSGHALNTNDIMHGKGTLQ